MKSTLKAYIPIANIMAKTFRNNCEVALHDLTQPENLVVYVANRRVKGRQKVFT